MTAIAEGESGRERGHPGVIRNETWARAWEKTVSAESCVGLIWAWSLTLGLESKSQIIIIKKYLNTIKLRHDK